MALNYKEPMSSHTRDMEMFRVFLGTVMSVDWERQVVTVEDLRTRVVYREVGIFPCSHSTYESTDVQMPEEGSTCACVPITYFGGHSQIAILSWTVSHTKQAADSIARKDYDVIPGLNERKRGNFRKAYPGQQASSSNDGYSERTGPGWDRTSRGFDRDLLDPHSRTWQTVTSRQVKYSDAGLNFEGPAVRPGASGITPSVMPDGSRQYALYLQPSAAWTDRYMNGKQDVVPFAEKVTKVQEFSLDYPLPPEAMQTSLIDHVLGTTANPWNRTTVTTQGKFQVDSQTYFADQDFDHPTNSSAPPLGPALNEGATPARKGFILERSEGTLVGFNLFDQSTYGQVLKPVLSELTGTGRFGADFESSYNPVTDSTDHIEARMAASCYSVRFPHEYNTTRWDITKEGMLVFEIGSTVPKENIQFQPFKGYEHPHGAGRSIEGHLTGSLKLVVGKNRDEEDAIDLQAMGQTVLRLGCDDGSLPDAKRSVKTQIRGSNDLVQPRALQYWTAANRKLKSAGDPGDLENKTAAESVSIRMALDGALVARLGARTPQAMRRHFKNGYSDAPGKQFDATSPNSHSPGRPTYGAGDNAYQFHDLTQAGSPRIGMPPYNSWLGNPVPGGMDAHGLSLDLHAVRDALVRIGKNPASGQSLLLDLDGGVVVAAGKDNQGRSLTGALDGGVELTIGQSAAKKGLRLEINGDVDLLVKGNMHQHVTGDYILECANFRQITKMDHVVTAQQMNHTALAVHLVNSPQILNNEGSTPFQNSDYI